jgi:hypothetical protein
MLAANGTGCRYDRLRSEQGGHVAGKTIQQVQEEHTDAWMAIPGVVGTAIGQCDGEPCILILTASNTDQVRRQLPSVLEGYPVVVQHVGEIRARDE